jgi:hypothetical protein
MRRIRRDKKRRIGRDTKEKNKMISPVYTFFPKWIKKGLALSKNPSE